MHKLQQSKKFMNTTITFTVIQQPGESTVEIQDAMHAGFGEFARIVDKFTRFNENSELANLNRNSGNWTGITPEFFRLVDIMLSLSHQTNGAFDPTVIDFLETYGYDPNYDFSKLDKPELDELVQKIALERNPWQAIELDYDNLKVRLAPGQRIDLGGIGKGYAIDQAFQHLSKFSNVLIDAGGDIRAKGLNLEGKAWIMNLLHMPATSEQMISLGNLAATDIAVACSGSWARKVKQFHHIIDTVSGKPIDTMSTVYVTAPNATLADGWATSLFVGGKNLVNKRDPSLEVMMISSEDNVLKTNGFPSF